MSLNLVYHHKQSRRADDRAYEDHKLRRALARNERECQVDLPVAHHDGAAESVSLKRRRIAPDSITPLPPNQRLPMDLLVRTMIVGGAAVALMFSRTCKWLHEEYRRILKRNREAKKEDRPQDVIPLRTEFIDACLDSSGLWEDVLINVFDGYAGELVKRVDMLKLARREHSIVAMVSLSFNRFLRRVVLGSTPDVLDKIVEAALLKGKPTVLEMVSIYKPQIISTYLKSPGLRGVLSSVSMIKYLVKQGIGFDVLIYHADKCALDFAPFEDPFPDTEGASAVVEFIFRDSTKRPPLSMLKDEKLQSITLRTYSAAPYRANAEEIYNAVLHQGDEECIKLALQYWSPPLRVVEKCIGVISRESAVLLAAHFSFDELHVLIDAAATFRCETECFYGLCIAMSTMHPGRTITGILWGAMRISRRLLDDVKRRLKEAELLVGQKLWESHDLRAPFTVTDSESSSASDDSDSESDSGAED
jgi:hypothetical protein